MKKKHILALALLTSTLALQAANTVESVNQVSSAVTLADDVDYHISSSTPFAEGGSINITNTAHATVILDNVLPSQAQSVLRDITINGAKAVSGVNCQLRMYLRGTMILPYTADGVLTVYTDENYAGTSSSDYAVDNVYNLKGKSLDNKISSFKLKRGYMVCFSTQADGKGGYSRVFIADKEDKEVKLLPKVLNNKVSFIRISKWIDASKKGWAGLWSTDTQNLFNTSWCYNWDASNHRDWTDRDYVTQHHHEGWPGISDVGNNTCGANILGNNEPDNKADDKEQGIDVKNVLANWPQMMATGRRLGSPAVAGNYSWLYEFIDSIDARGWRCDFIAVHAYWYSDKGSWESQLKNISKRCGGRPIWITEMNYGANWTKWPGSNTEGNAANYAIQKQHMAPTLDYLNNADYIERYAYYNNVQACRYAINTGDESLKDKGYLTPIGEYYAALPQKMAYNSAYDYVPKSPKMYAPQNLSSSFVPRSSLLSLNWTDQNGEFCDSMFVECRVGDKGKWTRLATVDVKDATPASYTYTEIINVPAVYYYRIHTYDFNGDEHFSEIVNNTITGSEGTEDVQWGMVRTSSTEDTYCFFEYPFATLPVVVCGSPSFNDDKVMPVERVASVTPADGRYTNYAFRYVPWNADGTKALTKAEESAYLVVKSGTGKLGSLNYEAGSKGLRRDTVNVTFAQPFAEAPVVLVTPQSSTASYPASVRAFDVTPTGFKMVQQRQKALTGNMGSITANYVAIEKGKTSLAGKSILVKDTLMKFTNPAMAYQLDYGQDVTNPICFAQQQTLNRKVTSLLRLRAVQNSCYLRLKVDNTDTENCAVSASSPIIENIGWVCISDDPTGISSPITDTDKAPAITVSGTTLDITDATAATAQVYGMNGVVEASVQLVGGKATVDLSTLPSGVHIVKTASGKTAKIVTGR